MGKDQDLIQAVKTNDVGTVRKILSKITSSKSKKGNRKLNINVQDEDGFTALHHTALMGNTEITMALLDIPECNVNARDKKGMSPLHLASWAGKTEIAKLLVQYRACVNTCADTGDTPLHLACQHHNAGVVEILLDSNVDCTVVNKNGESPLDLACRFGCAQVVELLLKSNDFPKLLALFEENPKTADPPLHIACKTGREEIVVMLLDAGADVNQRGTNGTALHEASLYGKTEVVRILLDNEADVSITNEEGYTPLDVVNHFTKSGASQDIKDLLREASKSKVIIAKAVHDYRNLYDPTCLSLKIGDTVEILEKNENGRWKGKVHNGKKEIIGYFPSSMVKLLNTKKTSVSGKPLSLKDAGVLPIGKYEMVTLPTATEQSSPVHDKRPRMSSFGKPNDRTPPAEPKREHTSPKHSYPNPITNGIKENRLFQKTQESLQYVEVAVDNSATSPTSIKSPTSPRPTEYAEVLLRDELRDSNDNKPPPSLPEKKFKVETGMAKKVEEDNDIWIKNSTSQPELPPKGRPLTPTTSTLQDLTANGNGLDQNTNIDQEIPEIPAKTNTKKNERKMKEWEKDLDLEEDVKPKFDLSTSSRNDSHSSDTLKPNYEDMTLNTLDKDEPLFKRHARKENYSPTKLELNDNDGRLSPGFTRRQLMSYENVELKGRQKDVIQSMLITEVDQDDVECSSHNYENVHKGFEKRLPSKSNRDNQEYEQMLPEDDTGMSKYETMKRGVSVEDLTGSGQGDQKDKRALTKSDSYENVDIKTSSISGPNDYLTENEPESPSHGYINIKIPVLPDRSSQASPVQQPGLTMNEYNALYDWLESCKLAIYIDNFVNGGFDMISVTGLTAEDLTAINITKTGHRKKLLSDSAKQKLPDNVFPSKRPDDIMTWLRLIHLDQYTPQLMDNGFDDMEFVQDITIEDLESIGITKPGHQRKLWLAVSALNSTSNANSAEQYLETDLDMVHENNLREEKDREVRTTDIDSALSRLPADGADLSFADEEVSTIARNTKKESSKQVMDNAVASLHIESLDETRGSTPDLDTILDSMDNEGVALVNPSIQLEDKKPSGPFQITPRRQQTPEELNNNGVDVETSDKKAVIINSQDSATIDDTKSNETVTSNALIVEPTENSTPSREDITMEPKQSNCVSADPTTQSRDDTRRNEPSCNTNYESVDPQDNTMPSHDCTKSTEDTSSSPLTTRHNSMESKTSYSSNQERSRGLSFDSKTSKKPPPPVKPKLFKKPPVKTPPKPTQPIDKGENERLERRHTTGQNVRSRQPPPVLPKTRHGSVHSTSSDGSIDSVIEELEQQKYYEQRRKSFEQLRKRFVDPESDGSSSSDVDRSEGKTRADSEGLQDQIKEVFRRSRENLVDSTGEPAEPVKNTSQVETTDEDLERDQQITDDLMKDINSMLSDFSTEIDCMFDQTDEKSTSV